MKRVRINSLVYKTLLSGAFLFFFYCFVWSDFGLIKHYAVSCQVRASRASLVMLKKDINLLERTVCSWKSDPFYLEKIAREELGMGYKDEVLYLYQS